MSFVVYREPNWNIGEETVSKLLPIEVKTKKQGKSRISVILWSWNLFGFGVFVSQPFYKEFFFQYSVQEPRYAGQDEWASEFRGGVHHRMNWGVVARPWGEGEIRREGYSFKDPGKYKRISCGLWKPGCDTVQEARGKASELSEYIARTRRDPAITALQREPLPEWLKSDSLAANAERNP